MIHLSLIKILWNTFYLTREKTETLGIVIIWLLQKQLPRWDKLHKNFVKGNMCERKYEKIWRRWGEKPDYNTSLTQDEGERERNLRLPIVKEVLAILLGLFFFNFIFPVLLVMCFFFSFIFISWRLITLQHCSQSHRRQWASLVSHYCRSWPE